MLMTAQGFRVASLFLKCNGDHAVVSVNQHDGVSFPSMK